MKRFWNAAVIAAFAALVIAAGVGVRGAGAGGSRSGTARARRARGARTRRERARGARSVRRAARRGRARCADAYLALGFAHAQDRLWQMELSRRSARGRLAELFGERVLARGSPGAHARLRRGGAAARRPKLSRDSRAALEAYSAGVNAWLGRDRGESRHATVRAALAGGRARAVDAGGLARDRAPARLEPGPLAVGESPARSPGRGARRRAVARLLSGAPERRLARSVRGPALARHGVGLARAHRGARRTVGKPRLPGAGLALEERQAAARERSARRLRRARGVLPGAHPHRPLRPVGRDLAGPAALLHRHQPLDRVGPGRATRVRVGPVRGDARPERSGPLRARRSLAGGEGAQRVDRRARPSRGVDHGDRHRARAAVAQRVARSSRARTRSRCAGPGRRGAAVSSRA